MKAFIPDTNSVLTLTGVESMTIYTTEGHQPIFETKKVALSSPPLSREVPYDDTPYVQNVPKKILLNKDAVYKFKIQSIEYHSTYLRKKRNVVQLSMVETTDEDLNKQIQKAHGEFYPIDITILLEDLNTLPFEVMPAKSYCEVLDELHGEKIVRRSTTPASFKTFAKHDYSKFGYVVVYEDSFDKTKSFEFSVKVPKDRWGRFSHESRKVYGWFDSQYALGHYPKSFLDFYWQPFISDSNHPFHKNIIPMEMLRALGCVEKKDDPYNNHLFRVLGTSKKMKNIPFEQGKLTVYPLIEAKPLKKS